MRVKNPNNESEPTNLFVKFVLPELAGIIGDPSFETDVVHESCYPIWHSRDHRVVIPLTEDNLNEIVSSNT